MIANMSFESKVKIKCIHNQVVWLQMPTSLTFLTDDIHS